MGEQNSMEKLGNLLWFCQLGWTKIGLSPLKYKNQEYFSKASCLCVTENNNYNKLQKRLLKK